MHYVEARLVRSSSMKRRTREISADGRAYVWLVAEELWPARVLRVWKAEQPRRIWIEQRDNGLEPITPAVVGDVIRERLAEESAA
jgi:hypothetical protein